MKKVLNRYMNQYLKNQVIKIILYRIKTVIIKNLIKFKINIYKYFLIMLIELVRFHNCTNATWTYGQRRVIRLVHYQNLILGLYRISNIERKIIN